MKSKTRPQQGGSKATNDKRNRRGLAKGRQPVDKRPEKKKKLLS